MAQGRRQREVVLIGRVARAGSMGLFDIFRGQPKAKRVLEESGPAGRRDISNEAEYGKWYAGEVARQAAKVNDKPSSNCPSCGVPLDPAPKRKTACPKCGRAIYVRRGRLLTIEDAKRFDWQREQDIDDSTWERERERLANSFGAPPSTDDIAWGILSQRASAGDTGALWAQARHLYENHRPFLRMLHAFHKARLREQKSSVSVLAESCCDACRPQHGKRLTASEAVQLSLLPQSACTRESNSKGEAWCNCAYAPAP